MSCCQLLTFFDSILVFVLTEWIFDDDLCYLDTAVCNREHRKGFLTKLTKCSIVNIRFDRVDVDSYKWISRRGMSLKRIKMANDQPLRFSPIVSIISRTVNLSYLSIDLLKVPAKTFLDIEMRVNTLQVLNSDSDSLVLFLTLLKNSVSHLDIARCHKLPVDIYPKIAMLCADLASIEVPKQRAFVIGSLLHCEVKFETFDCEEPSADASSDGADETDMNVLKPCYRLKLSSKHGREFNIVEINNEFDCLLTQDDIEKMTLHVGCLQSIRLKQSFNQNVLTRLYSNCVTLRTFEAGCVSVDRQDLIIVCTNCGLHLRSLKVNFISGIQEVDITEAIHHCPYLTELSIENIPISEIAYVLILELCPWLTSLLIGYFAGNVLNIANTFNEMRFHDGPFNSVQTNTESRMKLLSTPDCIYNQDQFFFQNTCLLGIEFQGVLINDDVLTNLTKYCPLLRKFSYCQKYYAWSTLNISLLSPCRELIILGIAYGRITDSMIETLLMDKPNFLRLDMHHSSGFTLKVCGIVGKYCPQIRYLDVSGTNDKPSCKAVVKLVTRCTHLHSLLLTSYSLKEASLIASKIPRELRLLKFEEPQPVVLTKSEDGLLSALRRFFSLCVS